jgi:hypothetical protein
MQKTFIGVTAIATLLAGCGGGGAQAAPAAAAARPLAAYLGEWRAECNNLARMTLSFKAAGDSAVAYASKAEIYDTPDCSGAVIATQHFNPDVAVNHVGSADASVVLAQDAAPRTVKVDQVTVVAPALTVSLSGSAVKLVEQDGEQRQCIEFSGGNRACFPAAGTTIEASTTSSAMYLEGDKLYLMTAVGSGYRIIMVVGRK